MVWGLGFGASEDLTPSKIGAELWPNTRKRLLLHMRFCVQVNSTSTVVCNLIIRSIILRLVAPVIVLIVETVIIIIRIVIV